MSAAVIPVVMIMASAIMPTVRTVHLLEAAAAMEEAAVAVAAEVD